MLIFFCLLSALTTGQQVTADVPSPAPAAPSVLSAQALPTFTVSYPLETPLAQPPTKTLQPRCESPPCSYGGEAQTLSASTVTSTILSTTSVPCYITTYVTDSTTTTETIYSTETVTSTITEEGTIYIIKYSPTPVIKSTVYESVIQITQTQTAMWVETEGAYSEETKTGEVKTVDGGSEGYDNDKGDKGGWQDAGAGRGNGYSAAPSSDQGEWKDAGSGAGASSAPAPAPAAAANAWTHASGSATAAVAAAATPVAVAGANSQALGGGAGPGAWASATPGVTVTGQAMANWHNSSSAPGSSSVGWLLFFLTAISILAGAAVLV
jgi:hypothetical protein